MPKNGQKMKNDTVLFSDASEHIGGWRLIFPNPFRLGRQVANSDFSLVLLRERRGITCLGRIRRLAHLKLQRNHDQKDSY